MQIIRTQKEFVKIEIGGYHDLYGQSDTLLLADVFENFQNMCLEMNLILQNISSGISMTKSFKKG